MDAPRSTTGTVVTALGVLAAGGTAGALVGKYVIGKNAPDPMSSTIVTIESSVFGVLAAGFGGLIAAAASQKWRRVGETTALVGVGAPLVLGALGLAKTAMALGSQAAAASQLPGPASYTVTSANTGQTIALNIGDTLTVMLEASYSAPTSSTTGVLSAGAATTPPAQTGSTTSYTQYPYTATSNGTVVLTAAGTSTFTLTVEVGQVSTPPAGTATTVVAGANSAVTIPHSSSATETLPAGATLVTGSSQASLVTVAGTGSAVATLNAGATLGNDTVTLTWTDSTGASQTSTIPVTVS